MKQRLATLAFVLSLVIGATGLGHADEDKPIGPGWLSLDSSVGLLDNKIAQSKGALEKALGITIGGFLDTSYTWSSNHPSSPANGTPDRSAHSIRFAARVTGCGFTRATSAPASGALRAQGTRRAPTTSATRAR